MVWAVAATTLAAARVEAGEPEAGDVLYRRYCAACHGVGGTGDGPAADALRTRPTDLTRLERDERELMAIIDGRRPVRAHGSAAMPVWGEVFEQSSIGEPHARRTALLRVQILARHVETLRKRSGDAKR
jgi:mono/diheme cytochrome c family protein